MKKVFALVMAAAILFSTMEVGLKVISQDLDPYQITFLRFLIGGIFLFPIAIRSLKKKNLKLDKKDFLYYIFLGTLNGVFTMSIFQLGLQYTKASIAAPLLCINPMFTLLLAHFMTDEKLNKRKIIALAISTIGIIIIINPMNITGEIKGVILVLIAAFGFGLYSVCGVKQVKKYGGITHTSISFLLGSAVLFILLLIFKRPVIAGINLTNIFPILYIGIVVSGVGYLAYFLAMEMAGANIAALTFFIKPVIAPFIAVITLNEKIEANTIVGILFIVAGSFVTLKLEQYFVALIKIKKGNNKYDLLAIFLFPYEQAVGELKIKFKSLRNEYRKKSEVSPIEFITGRVKAVPSIIDKAKKMGFSESEIAENMEDIAGIRIMCQFEDDIYKVVELIKKRDGIDMHVVYEKNYIKDKKESGYRSYHIIIRYPVVTTEGMTEILAEIQIRTLAMNFWATIEHSLRYKYKENIPERVAVKLQRSAEAAYMLDKEMLEIRDEVIAAQELFMVKDNLMGRIIYYINMLDSMQKKDLAIEYRNKLEKATEEVDEGKRDKILDNIAAELLKVMESNN